MKNEIQNHLYDPHWQEVLLLLLGELTPRNAAKFINTVLEQPSDENKPYHPLLFAGMCLGENPKNLHLAQGNALTAKVLQGLVELQIETEDPQLKSEVKKIFCNLKGTDFQLKALDMIEKHSDKIDADSLNQYREILADKINEV